MDLLAKLRAMSANGTATSNAWGAFKSGPRPSADLTRVLAVPRRVLEPTEALADKWTARLRRPNGTMRLRPIQAAALEEAFLYGGILGLIGTGFGKTLISLLLPTVWGSENAALLLPPNLKTKLFELEYPELSKHWRIPNLVGASKQYTDTKAVLHVVSYSTLSSAKNSDILERLGIDDLICDEVHNLRHSTAARTKRFKRFARTPRPKPARAHSEGNDGGGSAGVLRRRIAGLSGSITSGSVNDYGHLAQLILGERSPLPLDWHELQAWSYVLDAHEFPAPDGSLALLCSDGPAGESARGGYRRRLVETPGVVATGENDPGMGLYFHRAPVTAPKVVLDALTKLRNEWVRPDGAPLRETLEVYAAGRQLASGFFYKTVYPRQEPEALRKEWMDIRRAYFGEVRQRLALSIPKQDSYLLLCNAAESGRWASEFWKDWKDIRRLVEPATETVWLDKFLVNYAIEWAREKPGIIWAESVAVRAAEEISVGAGIPVYSGGAQDESALIHEDGSRSVVVSIRAFNAGINLQHAFKRNLFLTPPASNTLLEQPIARTHRPRNPALCIGPVEVMDDVTVEFCTHTPELATALADAREKARYVEETTPNAQKLNAGNWLF